MSDGKKRIEKMLKQVEQIRAGRARYEPFVELRVYSILNDEAALVPYHNGQAGGPGERSGIMSMAQAVQLTGGLPVWVNLMTCTEWLHAFYQRCDLYTDEQRERTREADMQHDEVRQLYDLDDAEEVIDLLAKLPQSFMIKG